MNNSIRPNLLIVGFQKCGSSSLFHLLTKHPEIMGSTPKETFALSDPGYEHYEKGVAWGTFGFSWAEFFPDHHQFSPSYYMEGSVCNFYQDKALKFAAKYPETKIIFVLRDPIQRFLSTYYYYGGNGIYLKPGTTLEDYYEKCVNKQHRHEAMKYALEHGRYDRYIQKWVEVLSCDSILVVGMNQIIKDKKNTLLEIFNFLNIQPLTDLELPHKNKSTVSRFPGLNRLLVNTFGGKNLSNTSVGKLYRKLTQKKPERLQMSDSLEKKLRIYYEHEYAKFSHYF